MDNQTRYISCQTCHKPVGNHHEAKTGICYDCSVTVAQDAERELAQWYTCAITEATRQEVIGRSALSYGLAPNWNQLSDANKEAFRRLRAKIQAEVQAIIDRPRYVDSITDGDGINRRLSRSIRVL